MKLSVIIVNYNVRHFLEQCLQSVYKSGSAIDMEVFVVDNNSVDGSVEMVASKFPAAHLIANKENLGFSKANNQAAALAKGEYILLLNPDTLIEEDTLPLSVAFMDQHPDAGGMGVKMVDGKGKFLPESKRGLPTPFTAFYKIFGFSRIFPHSRIFGRYHLGYLDKEKEHVVDVLCGAFMMMRKSALDKTGLLDETFFMYGEDIDLSYRITKAGYVNYYYPGTRIIHYKGESTRKGSINYVFVFYNAMIIFARKHFSKRNAGLFSLLIKMAIYLRAGAAIVSRLMRQLFLPLLDAGLIFGGIFFIKEYWEQQVIFRGGGDYPIWFIAVAVPVYIFVWLFAVFVSGGYDRPVRLTRIIRGLFWGTGVILTCYALLPEGVRFSRALIILGSVWAMISMLGVRSLLHLTRIRAFSLDTKGNRRFVVIGEADEARRVSEIIRNTGMHAGFIGWVDTIGKGEHDAAYLGRPDQLHDIIGIYRIDEVVFCSKSLSQQAIIDKMTELQYTRVDFRIAPPESLSIIGSKSINTAGDIYMLNVSNISRKENKRSKFLLDLMLCLLFLALLPVCIFVVRQPHYFIRNIFQVLFGFKSWVGYQPAVQAMQHLPAIRKGVLNPADTVQLRNADDAILSQLNILYAKDYRIETDLGIIWKAFRQLGRK